MSRGCGDRQSVVFWFFLFFFKTVDLLLFTVLSGFFPHLQIFSLPEEGFFGECGFFLEHLEVLKIKCAPWLHLMIGWFCSLFVGCFVFFFFFVYGCAVCGMVQNKTLPAALTSCTVTLECVVVACGYGIKWEFFLFGSIGMN